MHSSRPPPFWLSSARCCRAPPLPFPAPMSPPMFDDFCFSVLLLLRSLPHHWVEWRLLSWRASRALLAAGTEAALWLMRPAGRLTSLSTSGLALRRWTASRPPLVVLVPSPRLLLSSSFPSFSLLSSPPRSSAGAGPLWARAGRLLACPLAWGGPFGGLPLMVAPPERLLPSIPPSLGDGVCASHVVTAIVGLLAADHLLQLSSHAPRIATCVRTQQSLGSPPCGSGLARQGPVDCVTSLLRRSWPLRFLPCPRWVSFKVPRRCRRSASP